MKAFLKKNKALLILPIVLLPFVILIFYILGGGKQAELRGQYKNNEKIPVGANYILPEAERAIEIFDKMEAYEQEIGHSSTKDYNVMGEGDTLGIPGYEQLVQNDTTAIDMPSGALLNKDVPKNLLAHIKQKEEDIKKQLEGQENELSSGKKKKNGKSNNYQNTTGAVTAPNTKKQQQPPAILNTTGIEELDKVFNENRYLNRQNDSLNFFLGQAHAKLLELEQKRNSGFTLDKKQVSDFEAKEGISPLIKAEIYETTTVLDGNRVKLRLLEETTVNGIKISENSFIYGICKINNERLHILVTQLPVKNNFLPVKLVVLDLDGLPGLYVPDNAARKVSKEVGSSTNTSSLFGVTNNPLTYAGIRAADRTAQTMLKGVRIKKVTIKKNILAYLINQK